MYGELCRGRVVNVVAVRRLVLTVLAAHAMLQAPPAVAEIVPPRGAVDSRVRVVPYDENQVYRLHGFVGYQIDLQFESGESFVGLGAGDIEALAYYAQDNHLFIKPKAAKVATNLTVLTNRRHYQFAYTALAERPHAHDMDVVFALSFTYPLLVGKLAEEAVARRIESQLKLAEGQRRQNRDYWYCGEPSLRPVLAADDGVHTRLRFAVNSELPAIFVRNDDDSESLLNFNMDEGDVLIHRIARRFILRRGNLVGCIVNKGFAGSAARLESGTVTPDVERRLRVGPR